MLRKLATNTPRMASHQQNTARNRLDDYLHFFALLIPAREVCKAFDSYLSSHVLHPGQSQLSQVAMFHSGAHQWHGDVPDWSQKEKRTRRM